MKTKTQLKDLLAVNVKRIRVRQLLTQEQLAEKAGYSVAYISLLERAGRTAPLSTAAALGVPALALLGA